MYLYANIHPSINNKIFSGDSKVNTGGHPIQPSNGEMGGRLGAGTGPMLFSLDMLVSSCLCFFVHSQQVKQSIQA